jgi:hypothetical protein
METYVCGDCGDELMLNPDAVQTGEVVTEHSNGRLVPVYSQSRYLHAGDRTPQCQNRSDAARRKPERFVTS